MVTSTPSRALRARHLLSHEAGDGHELSHERARADKALRCGTISWASQSRLLNM